MDGPGEGRQRTALLPVWTGPSARFELSELVASRLAGEVTDGVALHARPRRQERAWHPAPGQSRAGKSSLVAWLVDRGFDYCTDN